VNLKALIFDVDGTLADTEETHRRAFNESFEQHDLDWRWSKPLYAELLRTTGGKERIAAYLALLPLAPAERSAIAAKIPEIHRVKTAIYARMVADGGAPLRDGVERLLDEAAFNGVRLAIATTTTFENVRTLLETTLGRGALARFEVIGAGDDVARKKPAPDIYDYVIRHLGVARDQCVAVEDSANGLAAAKAAGLFTLVTPSYWTHKEDLSSSDLLVPHLGSPERPLPENVAQVVGGPVVGVREIDACLSRTRLCA
jgi:HAD superfamily hydrolase (TIGR01509 family)